MGRREQAAEMRSTWMVYEPKVTRTPMTRKDLYDAEERAQADAQLGNPLMQTCLEDYPLSPRVYPLALAKVAKEASQVPMRK